MKIVERHKVCARCQTRKPWSDYYTKVKWPDGSMQRPQSRCKPCFKAARNEAKREARRQGRETPEQRAIRLDYHRNWQRARNGVTPDRYRTGRIYTLPQHGGPTLDPALFTDWLSGFGSNPAEIALHTGVNERRVRSLLNGEQDRVELDTVDRALLHAADGTELSDLYPMAA